MNLIGRRALVVAGAAVLVVAAAGTALAVGVPSHSRSHTASLAAGGRSSATLEVVTGTPLLTVRVASLGGTGGTLLRASTPADAPSQVRLSWGDSRNRAGEKDVAVLSASGGTTPVTVTLNETVSWRLDFAGGTERTVADLRGGKVAAVTFTAGSDTIDLSLPTPHGMVPVRLAGGASQFLVTLPGGAPVRVTAAGGAGEVLVDGASYSGVGGGSVFATEGWSASASGFDVDATAGAALLSVARYNR